MVHQFSRNELAFGTEGLERLKGTTVLVLGIGGVGSFAAEACARSGVGKLILVDKDTVDITNVNRQLVATLSTVGREKVDVMKERVADINPDCEVVAIHAFYTEETYEAIFAHEPDYVIDASDTIRYKIHIAEQCIERGIPIISSMGAANKLDPTRFQIADISKTHTDPLAKVVRTRLRKKGIHKGLTVVFSDESPIVVRQDVVETVGDATSDIRKAQLPPSSNAFVPSTAGLICASWVVRRVIEGIPIERVND
ncbi:MAG TPA: tRNA threonylcarbamoyladenosine dehydratase [Savagea sp.]